MFLIVTDYTCQLLPEDLEWSSRSLDELGIPAHDPVLETCLLEKIKGIMSYCFPSGESLFDSASLIDNLKDHFHVDDGQLKICNSDFPHLLYAVQSVYQSAQQVCHSKQWPEDAFCLQSNQFSTVLCTALSSQVAFRVCVVCLICIWQGGRLLLLHSLLVSKTSSGQVSTIQPEKYTARWDGEPWWQMEFSNFLSSNIISEEF